PTPLTPGRPFRQPHPEFPRMAAPPVNRRTAGRLPQPAPWSLRGRHATEAAAGRGLTYLRDHPGEHAPMAAFRYVETVREEDRTVVVELGPGRDPQQVVVGGAQLACHLYLPPGT